jgi:hypothetical protein
MNVCRQVAARGSSFVDDPHFGAFNRGGEPVIPVAAAQRSAERCDVSPRARARG